MAFEKRDAAQVVTWAPPLPQRAFQVTHAGSTTEVPAGSGIGPEGTRYGWYTISTSQWATLEGQHTPPISAGEKFQLWKANPASVYSAFPSPPAFAGGNVRPGAPPAPKLDEAPDLFAVYPWTVTRETGGQPAPYLLQDPTVCTVIAVQQQSATSWNAYFSPTSALGDIIVTSTFGGQSGIITIPALHSPRWLGRIGHVANLDYTFSLPGGPDQLTATVQIEPDFRTDALNPGRAVTVHKGGSCIWEGILTEPVPAATGWTITANGVGTYGTNFAAWWEPGAGPTKGSSGWTSDAPPDFAIARGLRWRNPGIGSPAGIYLGPVQNPGSITITDFLNLLCTGGSLTWELAPPASASSFPPGPWELKVYPLPQDFSGNPLQAGPAQKVQTSVLAGHKWKRVDRIIAEPRIPPALHIISTSPVQRSIVADYNTIVVYYQATPDVVATSTKKAVAATYATTFADVPGSVAIHGRMEYYVDISNGGVYAQAGAQTVARNILNKYIRANFSTPFAVQPGQLVNDGGVPVDLGCNWGGYTADVIGINYAFGGEVGFAPITFVIGEYEFSDDSQTATITPYQSARTDIASIISMLYPGKFA